MSIFHKNSDTLDFPDYIKRTVILFNRYFPKENIWVPLGTTFEQYPGTDLWLTEEIPPFDVSDFDESMLGGGIFFK